MFFSKGIFLIKNDANNEIVNAIINMQIIFMMA